MKEHQSANMSELLTISSTALREKRFHDALINSFIAYLIYRDRKDKNYEKAALVSVDAAIDGLSKEYGLEHTPNTTQRICSFCSRQEPAVRLAAGAHGFICDSCVMALNDVFNAQ